MPKALCRGAQGSMPRSPRHSGSDGSLWVSLRVLGKEPARRLREGKRIRDSIPIALSLCRRGREARGPDTGTATSRQSAKPDARFRPRKRKENREREPRGERPPPPPRRPGTPTLNSREQAGFSLTHSPPAARRSPPQAQEPQPQPRPAPGHAPRPCRGRRSRSRPESASRFACFLLCVLLVKVLSTLSSFTLGK